jgi:DNA-binding NarL/FixJ family response regulator
MPIRVLLADDSDVMRTAIVFLLKEESSIQIVGEASSFAQTVQMIADLKPDVLVLDLHMPEKRNLSPVLVKAQFASVDHVLAVSFSNDEEAKILAESYGAAGLLDKMNLYSELIPAIRRRLSNPTKPPRQKAALA